MSSSITLLCPSLAIMPPIAIFSRLLSAIITVAWGLFRHGLEVAKFACQFAQANQFCPKDLPRLKRDNENRWQFAAFVAGLTHDLGKPLSDLVVRDRSGEQVWNPYEITLVDWLYTNDIDRYFIGWNGDRNKRHKTTPCCFYLKY